MIVVAFANVTNISLKKENPKDAKGNTDWEKTVEYYESTLSILDNNKGIEGRVHVREKLDFGKFYRIMVNTDDGVDVVKDQVVTDAKVWP